MKTTNLLRPFSLLALVLGLLLFQFACSEENKQSSESLPEVSAENAASESGAMEETEMEPKSENNSEASSGEGVINRASLCADIADYKRCVETIERTLFENHSGVFEAEEGGFRVHLLSGEDKVYRSNAFEDENEGHADDFILYRPANYYPATELVLVEIVYFEGGGYELVSRKNGKTYSVFNAPHFSPDLKHFVTFNADLVAGFEENGFEVWATYDGDPERMLKVSPEDWAPKSVNWLGNGMFELQRYTLDYEGTMEEIPTSIAVYEMGDDGHWYEAE